MKAIETRYKGYRFRSRLEARWAVYFDALGLKWDYELQGFVLDGVPYLPDFWLPQVRMWAEVKPEEFTDDEMSKVVGLARHTGRTVLLLIGTPDYASYVGVGWREDQEEGEADFCDYVISMYHGYPIDEHRFYCQPGWDWSGGQGPGPIPSDQLDFWEDEVGPAIHAARSARFEHGETPSARHP